MNRRILTIGGVLNASSLLLVPVLVAILPINILRAAQQVEAKSDINSMDAEPKDDKSKALFKNWKTSARTDGKIPGGYIGEMATALKTRMDLNAGSPTASRCEVVFKKCDVTRDWTPAEAASLLDEIEVAAPAMAEWVTRANVERQIHFGKTLPVELKDAPWGSPEAQGEQLDASSVARRGLRMAWLLDPQSKAVPLGSVMKSRVLFHNTGKIPVCFATENWIQSGMHSARDTEGKGVYVWSTHRLGRRTRMIFHLAPGEYAEVEGHSIGVGSHESATENRPLKAGAWIEAKTGDVVTFLPGKLHVSFQTWQNNEGRKDSRTVWNETIAARVAKEGPWPASKADREQLLQRVSQDLGISLPTEESIVDLLSDNSSDCLDKLTVRLHAAGASMHFSGELSGSETTFEVTEARAKKAAVNPQVADPESLMQPKHKDARALYEVWQRYARSNGDIPGALVGEVAAAVKTFIHYNPTWETVPQLNEILPRLDATHDWKPADVIALLDEVAGIQDSPLKVAAERATRSTIRNGEALRKEFADAAWGDAQPNGLRATWVLEPSVAEHRIGAALKARLLVWNSGAASVSLQVPTFHQGGVKARDAADAEVQVSGISWTTRALLVPVRLAPGEYIEIRTPGVGIGPRAGMGPWAGPRVGSNLLAKPGDELTLTYSLLPLDGSEVGISEDNPHVSGPGWWLAHIKTRLSRELPLPDDDAERTRLLDRAVRELFATAPTAEETAAFIADETPDALDALAKRLVERVDVVSFSGKLPTAPTKFRVLAADANVDKQPRVVLGPGEYPLPSTTARRGDATLKIVGRPVGDRRTNDAQLLFEPVEFTGALPPDPHKLEVPDGWGTWAIVSRPGEDFFYLLHKGGVRKIDYSKPRQVTDTTATDLPAEFRDEVKRQLDILEISDKQQGEIFEKPAASTETPDSRTGANASSKLNEKGTPKLPRLPDESYTKTGVHCQKFVEEDAKRSDGKRMGYTFFPLKPGERPLLFGVRVENNAKWSIGSESRVELVVRNKCEEDLKFAQTFQSDVGLSVVAIDKEGKEYPATIAPSDTGLMVYNRLLLPKHGYVATVKSFTVRFNAEKRFDSDLNVAAFHIPPGKYKLRCTWNDAHPDVAHEGEWTGELVNEEVEFTLTEAVNASQPAEASEVPQTTEQSPFTAWGEAVGGLQAGLGFKTEQRAYTHSEMVTLVLRVRNIGKKEVKFSYFREEFYENPPFVTDAAGKSVPLEGAGLDGEPRRIEAKLAPGKEIDLSEINLVLRPASERGNQKPVWTLFGTGKFQLQCARVAGNFEDKVNGGPDPILSKLATGKLELETSRPPGKHSIKLPR